MGAADLSCGQAGRQSAGGEQLNCVSLVFVGFISLSFFVVSLLLQLVLLSALLLL